MGINVITAVKSVAFFGFERKEKPIPLYALLITIAITFVFGIVVFDGSVLSALPVALSIFYSYGTWQKNLKVTYIFGTIVGVIWLGYNLSVGAYVATIGNVFEVSTSLIGFYKLMRLKYDKSK